MRIDVARAVRASLQLAAAALAGVALFGQGACTSGSADEVCVNNLGFCIQSGDASYAAYYCESILTQYPCATGYVCCQPKADAHVDASAYYDAGRDASVTDAPTTPLPEAATQTDGAHADAPHDAATLHDSPSDGAASHEAGPADAGHG